MKDISISSMRWKLFQFGLVKIPMIGYCKPKITSIDHEEITIHIRLRRRTRNHVGSMYLGVMTIGADLASGFLAYSILESRGLSAAPVFSEMKATYVKRATSHVDFVCSNGEEISNMIDEAQKTKERVTKNVHVTAFCGADVVAHFEMGLSLKLI